MMEETKHYQVRVFYEDTDHSGVVYHANYLKYFERAREDYLGYQQLIDMGKDGIGFAVYKAELSYNEGAEFGDVLDIRSTARFDGDYRTIFLHEAWRENSKKAAVKAEIQLVCLNRDKKLLKISDLKIFK
ncbi:MAG: YbgC/FadM family acyl-CoA thioesterase [Desulfobacteraceae bacterium]|nr:YbgC/FadM family acyl-CoA thioesterase [Desulfobacteraceae bacterium]